VVCVDTRVGVHRRDERQQRLPHSEHRDGRRGVRCAGAAQLQAFKVGINKSRRRGDREEVFGGIGESRKGALVGGDLLVARRHPGPRGDAERLFGNFPNHSLYLDGGRT
jgi:hypothetical protein